PHGVAQLGVRDHVGARALPAFEHPGVHQGLHGFTDRVASHADEYGQLGFRWDAGAHRPGTRGDLLTQTAHCEVDQIGTASHPISGRRLRGSQHRSTLVAHPPSAGSPAPVAPTGCGPDWDVMSPNPAGTRHPWRGRSIVLLGITLVALNLRIAVASVSPVLDDVRADVGLTATQVGLLGTVPVVAFALFGSLTPMIGRRIGLAPSLVVAMVVSAVGEVLRSTTSAPLGFLGWSIIALAGMGMGNVLLPPVVKRYFPDRIGAVTAVYAVAMGFSTAVPP